MLPEKIQVFNEGVSDTRKDTSLDEGVSDNNYIQAKKVRSTFEGKKLHINIINI